MVTYSELFQLLMLLVAFAGLIVQISSKRPHSYMIAVKFFDNYLRE